MLNPLILALSASATAVTTPPEEPPVACRLGALDATQRQRQKTLLDKVRGAALEIRELPDGFTVRFPADPALFVQLAEWIGLERRCCPFLRFTLEWKTDEAVFLRLTGPPGVKELIASELKVASER
jgi:hypothetical protein